MRRRLVFCALLLPITSFGGTAVKSGGETEGESLGETAGNGNTGSSKRARGFGFLKQAFHEVKRVAATVDPQAVADAEEAWNELQPDIQQAVDELRQARNELTGLKNDAGKFLADVKRVVLKGDERSNEVDELTTGIEFKDLARDAAEVAKGIFGEVLGDVTSEITSTFETRLSEALSEGNLREASKIWQGLLDTPGAQVLLGDRSSWAGAERAVRKYLSSYMSEETLMEAKRAANATANFALHFAGLGRNAAKSDYEVFQELSSKMCHLQGAAEKLWPLTSRTLPLLGYQDYISRAEKVLRANTLSRITLTVSAGALLDLNPRNDPFLMTLIASFSLGHMTKDVAVNLANFFLKAVVEKSIGGVGAAEQGHMSTLDLVTELVGGTSTCDELGRQAFEFFEMVKRAISTPESTAVNIVVAKSDSAEQSTSTPPAKPKTSSQDVEETQGVTRSPRKLGTDGFVLQVALWIASIVDEPRYYPALLLSLVSVFAFLSWALWWLWRWSAIVIKSGRSGKGRGEYHQTGERGVDAPHKQKTK